MKSKGTLFLLSILCCLLVLSGCQCKHEWTDANCLTAKTCTQCGETEGEALGHTWTDATCTAPKTRAACGVTEGTVLEHSWADATCEAPKTCTACGKTEGEAPGHTYGPWDFGETEMTRTCEVCHGKETAETDRELWLRHILEGSWDLVMEVKDSFVTFTQSIDGFRPMALSFHGDNQGYWYMGTEAVAVTWGEARVSDANPGLLAASLKADDQSVSTAIYVDPKEETLYLFTGEAEYLVFSRNQALTQALTGFWACIDYNVDTLKLSADHTFTGSIERYNRDIKKTVHEDISGIWYVSPEYDYGGLTFCDLCLCVNGDGNDDAYTAAVHLGVTQSYSSDSLQHEQLEMSLSIDYGSRSFDGMDDEAYAELEYVMRDLPCGLWTSTKISKGGNSSETDAYSINFAEDGTFTAVLDTEITGTWLFNGFMRTENEYVIGYSYMLLFAGRDEYTSFHVYVDEYMYGDPYLFSNGCQFSFQQMTEEKIAEREAIRKEAAEKLVGPWASTEIYDYDDQNFRAADGYSFNFAEDGSFTAMLDQEYTGTWGLEQVAKDEEGNVYSYRYSLTFDGIESNSRNYKQFFIPTNGDARFIAYNSDCEIYFQQMTEEKIAEREAARAEAAQKIAGLWTSYCRAYEDGQDNNWWGYSFTFAKDGTFTAVLNKKNYTGTWEYTEKSIFDIVTTYTFELKFDEISTSTFVSLDIYDPSWQIGHTGNKKLGLSYDGEDGKHYTIWFEWYSH